MAELLWEYLAERDIGAALTALEESDEQTTVNPGGSGRKISTTRRTTAALDAWTRAQSAAAGHRQRLGLDPLSRARLGRDVSTAAAMQTAQIEQHAATGAAIRARRGVLSAPETASQLIDHTEHADEQGDDRDDR